MLNAFRTTIPSAILVSIAVFVNGCTDAPNSVATVIATKALSRKKALILSGIFNFLGVVITSVCFPFVANTIYRMVNFHSQGSVTYAVTACMFSVALYALVAMKFGIPTSESHAMVAALAGAGVVMQGSLFAVNGIALLKTVCGLAVSVISAEVIGFFIAKYLKKYSSKKPDLLFDRTQIAVTCASSFMHGAQDGQKFLGLFMLVLMQNDNAPSLQLIIFVAVIMATGTRFGGKKIIESVGFSLAPLQKYQGLSADLASSIALLVCSFLGMPSSTTHTVSSAIVGCAFAENYKEINVRLLKNLLFVWLITFPACFALSAFFATVIKLIL